jgi:HPt (histidine-containing phosphotransfer) domain-containing protein
MNLLKIAGLGLALSSTGAYADCTAPEQPTMPDGASSTMEQMLEGQKAVKTFQAANLEYMACIEKQIAAAEAQAKNGDDSDAAQSAHDAATEAYNAAVSAEEEVAGQFNTQIRAYKAANPK